MDSRGATKNRGPEEQKPEKIKVWKLKDYNEEDQSKGGEGALVVEQSGVWVYVFIML